jgi:hypothetical protein
MPHFTAPRDLMVRSVAPALAVFAPLVLSPEVPADDVHASMTVIPSGAA